MPGTPDAPVVSNPMIDAPAGMTVCGKPGDVGNELGVGQYCASLGDCKKPTAPLCSVLGNKDTHFCTKTCKTTDPATVCGTGAQCVCNENNQCGCTPSSCLGM